MNKKNTISRSKNDHSEGSGTIAILIAFVALAFILFNAISST
ncbi:MAG: hypothetical protein Q8L90_08250 [Bacteroidota bacterium]|nr:hypothetical protein [Bacteroidota bacterium]